MGYTYEEIVARAIAMINISNGRLRPWLVTTLTTKTCCYEFISRNVCTYQQMACLFDVLPNESDEASCVEAREHLITLRKLLITLFQMANVLLLLGSIVESAILLQIYLWYMLAYIVISFVLAIVEFCFLVKEEGVRSFASFVPEVLFLFGELQYFLH
ncbi:jg13344 [Pararge aegeria aegeria]|uniref:Jg13344 protein n=1 Tax=Pararge aegeria aegeria TaxID=348720 RepID=A0A8S4SG48_9NEOP|nr:jg13344 [Pararge aegeria aegeria]